MTHPLPIEVVIFGGGAAGLWLLDELVRAGRSTLLLEAHELGSGQTIASQGIIHGGLKYSLSGLLTPSARAISQMPLIWRRCLAGEAKPDLTSTRLRAEFCYLWRTTSLRSRLAMIGARAGLQVSPVKLSEAERPAALAECPGVVARLDEQVIDPLSLIADLSNQHAGRIIRIDAANGLEFVCRGAGEIEVIRLINPETGDPLDVVAEHVIFAAGAGNAKLRDMAGLEPGAMQRRPLHMVMARGGNLPVLNAHCVDGRATRVTITSTRDFDDRIVWQIGGQIAEAGTSMSPDALIAFAKSELAAVLPGLRLRNVEWATYRVDRAEAATAGGARPDEAFAQRTGNTVTAWPTKLALVPVMADRVRQLIPQEVERLREQAAPDHVLKHWPRPVVALPPWETHDQWNIDD